MKARYLLLLTSVLVVRSFSFSQIVLDNTMTPNVAVQDVLLGNGVTVSNITFNGQPGNLLNEQLGGFDGSNCSIGMNNGVILATGDINDALGPNNNCCNSLGGGNFGQGDPDLAILSGQTINDAAILEFDFIPTGDSLKFDFVFASDEYPDFVCSINDVFGFFLSGPGINGPFTNNAINIALIPGTNVPVGVNTVNNGIAAGDPANCAAIDPLWDTHTALFVDNGDGSQAPYNVDPFYVQYDGFTVTITARALVTCGLTYHIKLAIGDASDTAWDSAVFLKAGSFGASGQVIPSLVGAVNVVNDSMIYEGCGDVLLNLIRVGDTTNVDTVDLVISGSATPGVDYIPPIPSQLIYQPGDTVITIPLTVPLDPDGLETIHFSITQNIVCSGQQVTTDYQFYITSAPPLAVITNDVNGACGQQYVLAPDVSGGTGNPVFLWDTGETTPTITVGPSVTTVYHFTVSDTCSVLPVTDSITVTMPVFPPMVIGISPDVAIDCLGNDDISVTTVSGGNGTYTYDWELNGVNVGNTAAINVPAQSPAVYYVATVTDGCGSFDTDSVLVSTAPLPPIVITAQSRTVVCPGDTTTLNVGNVTGGNGVYTYVWTNASNTILSLVDSVTVPVPTDAAYTITVADQCGYVGDTMVFTLLPVNDPFKLDLNNDTVICYGDSLRLWAHVTGGSGYYTIEWVGEDWSDPYLMVQPEADQTWTVNIFDRCGATINDEVKVEVEKAEARIIATSRGLDDWFFEAATLPTFCKFYRWDLGDSTLSRERTLPHSYLDLEEHWVHLKVITFNGCHAEDSLLLRPPAEIYFPNAFTPDGDGLNEAFGPVSSYIEQFQMTIFDRWGEVVFETEDLNHQWDGRVNGTDAKTGVYVYKYKATGHFFPTVEAYGHVSLLRGATGK